MEIITCIVKGLKEDWDEQSNAQEDPSSDVGGLLNARIDSQGCM